MNSPYKKYFDWFMFSMIQRSITIFPKPRIIRLLKLNHSLHGTLSLLNTPARKRFEFIVLGYMLLGVTFSFGTVLYLQEYGISVSWSLS